MTVKLPKKRINLAELQNIKTMLSKNSLHTVCQSALCPNIEECFKRKTASFLIAGDVCTRNCTFCAIDNSKPAPLDESEPQKIADTLKELKLNFVVITSVTRDDLPDGGAEHFVKTITAIRKTLPECKVEVLVPDFKGNNDDIETVCNATPDVFAHNIETVERLYPNLRSMANYKRSLKVLQKAKELGCLVKSGIMLGLGETIEEVRITLTDLKNAGCEIVTIGQYYPPQKTSYPVKEKITDEQFANYKEIALKIGFTSCASGTFVRSSYFAETSYKIASNQK